jgi:putative ABC transport system permease protein
MSQRRSGTVFGYGLLLRLLPKPFRQAHGSAMQETFEAAYHSARRLGRGAVIRLWLRELWDHAHIGAVLALENLRLVSAAKRDRVVRLHVLLTDFRLAVRSISRQPVSSTLAAITLAFGIGAAAALFGTVKPLILYSPSFPAADRMVTVWRTFGSGRHARLPLLPEQEIALRSERQSFEAVEAFSAATLVSTGTAEPSQLRVLRATVGLPALLGVAPEFGRSFTSEEMRGEGARVVLLSGGFWRSKFGGRTDIVGKPIELNGESWTIIGAMADVERPDDRLQPLDVWIPLGDEVPFRTTIARIAEGVTIPYSSFHADSVLKGSSGSRFGGIVLPLTRSEPPRNTLRMLMGALTLLLLVTCVNVAILSLQRGKARQREIATLAVLGAARPRLLRQLLFESLVIATVGGLAGGALAHTALRWIFEARLDEFALLGTARLDTAVLLSCIAMSTAAGLAGGIVPAIITTRVQPISVFGRSHSSIAISATPFQLGVVSLQIALSFALLVVASLLIVTQRELSARTPGFSVANLLSMEVRLPEWRFTTAAEKDAAFERMIAALQEIPSVEMVGLGTSVPPRIAIGISGRAALDAKAVEEAPMAFHVIEAAPEYFAVLGLELTAGSYPGIADATAEVPSVLLSESAARRLRLDGDVLSRRFQIEGSAEYDVVGVVRDIRLTGLTDNGSVPLLYFPLRFASERMTLAIRVRYLDPEVLLILRETVRLIVPEAFVDIDGVDAMFRASIDRERLTATLFALFAVLTLVLAAVGLFAVLSQVVVGRTREIGLRMALGAGLAQISALVLKPGFTAVAAGATAGAAIAVSGLQLLPADVYVITSHRSVVFVIAALVVLAVALLAMLFPLKIATRMDPKGAVAADQ